MCDLFGKLNQFLRAPPGSGQIQPVAVLRREHGILQQRRGGIHQKGSPGIRGIQQGKHIGKALHRLEAHARSIGNVTSDAVIVLFPGGDHGGNIVALAAAGKRHRQILRQGGFPVLRAPGNQVSHTVNWSPFRMSSR